ncbi:Adhesion G-protein coupled receptor G2 [Frankliniella fusca]|uniref:Adhesion G-protein coupled receptor G2 n=1 Tax=Frankliniella fusca TaxID=407009 RepID=A0AAE1LT36_9NEOP|nr:Adhesion G-protein coupled receptor G2 [Frankliniella fusca]
MPTLTEDWHVVHVSSMESWKPEYVGQSGPLGFYPTSSLGLPWSGLFRKRRLTFGIFPIVRLHNAKMRILLCCVLIALGVQPMPPIKTMLACPPGPDYSITGRSSGAPLRGRRAAAVALVGAPPAAPAAPAAPAPYAAALGAPFAGASLVGPWRQLDVAPVDAGDSATTTPAAASSSTPEETTTEEPYDSGDEGSDFGSDILNTLLEVVGSLLSFFSDPPGAIQKMVDQATKLFSGARSLIATVRAQRQAGVPIPDGVPDMVEQVKKLLDAAEELGPAGARRARIMLVEAQRILETAKGIVETTGRISNSARKVAQTISRPWTG